ncbi:hypothetical protein ACHAXR_002803 [Thalassiosira sp. AJA248-18]
MPPPRISNCNGPRRISRRRRTSPSSFDSLTIITIFLASSCLLHHPTIITNAEPHSTIPRSNNRYTHYNNNADSSGSASLDNLSSPLNRESYHPPWNPSPRIDPHGFLSHHYTRTPGEWEPLANIRGKHGPRNTRRYTKLLKVPMQIRQVPGDGNCLFHSIAACLHHEVNGTHLPMDSYECIGNLRHRSLELRNAAVDILHNAPNKGRRRLFLQGEEYLEARELLNAAAAQFDLMGEEYCELMRKESYWGGGPEIVALCNYLQRPIHIYCFLPRYELISAEEASNHHPSTSSNNNNIKTCNQFTLRRMACFGSPKFDRREPLHILSADSRFPDVEPRRIRKVGNHFLALFPVNDDALNGVNGEGGEQGNTMRFRRHALIRGGSRIEGAAAASSSVGGRDSQSSSSSSSDSSGGGGSSSSSSEISERMGKWDGGRGSWTHNVMDWFVKDNNGGGIDSMDQRRMLDSGRGLYARLGGLSDVITRGFSPN